MFFKVINYNWYKNPQKKRCGERWKKLKKNKPDEVWRVQVRGVRGLYLVPQMVHTYTENVKCHHDISLNSKALSETHKPFLSFVFQKLSKKTKKSLGSPWHWLKCFAPRIVHIPGTHEESSPQLTCLFIRNSWFVMDSPFTACLFLSTSHTARCKEMIC